MEKKVVGGREQHSTGASTVDLELRINSTCKIVDFDIYFHNTRLSLMVDFSCAASPFPVTISHAH